VTVEDVRAEVEAIRAIARDDERAHGREDELHQAVLVAISDGAANAVDLAREALKTQDVKFARWCA
jgi:tellurite resistance protein